MTQLLNRSAERIVLLGVILVNASGHGQDAVQKNAATSPHGGTDYYVSTNGTNNVVCSKAKPCREVAGVTRLLLPGSTVHFAEGNYSGFDIMAIHGTKEKPITLRAEGKNVVILPAPERQSPSKNDNIYVVASSHIIIDGIITKNAPRAGIRIDRSRSVTVRNSTMGDNGKWGIFANFADELVVENNSCYGSKKEHGIYVADSSQNPTIRGNRLYGNNGCGLHMNGDLGSGKPGLIRGGRVEGNVIYGNGRKGGAGINMDGVQDSIILNNLLYGNLATGIAAFKQDAAEGPKNVQILNNTIVQANGARNPVQILEPAGKVTLRNNILYHPDGKAGINFGSLSAIKQTDSDYNVVSSIAVDGSPVYLASWKQTYKNSEQHSLPVPELNQLFIDPGKQNYALAEKSYAKQKGAVVSDVPRDLASKVRGSPPSIGAIE